MVIISAIEIIKLAVLSLALGFIFMGIFPRKPKTVFNYMNPKRFNFDDYWFAVIISAPAVILHELAHKFVALYFGFSATFEIFYLGLAIGIILRLLNSPFLILAPAFVSIGQEAFGNDIAYRLIAFAGPFMNLLLWFIALIVIKFYSKKLNRASLSFWLLTRNVNLLLFIFNMIPFGPIDGAKVIFGV